MLKRYQIFVGYEPREADGFAATVGSLRQSAKYPDELLIKGIVLDRLIKRGLYRRATLRGKAAAKAAGKPCYLWDEISAAPMSTEFAISRFLVPELTRNLADLGKMTSEAMEWAVFMDCDMLVRRDIRELFGQLKPQYAVQCVKHNFEPTAKTKMDGQPQVGYPRKNWSSVMAFNLKHPANKALTVDLVNTRPGRDLHRFCWLDDSDIGSLGAEWNWLVGYSDAGIEPAIVHFAEGVPSMAGYEDSAFAGEWRDALASWAVSGGLW